MTADQVVAPLRYVSERDLEPHVDDPGFGLVALYAEFPDGRREQVRHVVYHSPTGLEYGYGGSGPADMALSILAHFYGVDARELSRKIREDRFPDWTEGERRAVQWHQDFKRKHVETADRFSPLIVYSGELFRFGIEQMRKERA